MCGIVGAIADRRCRPRILMEGPKRLEYRGYDSAGIAVRQDDARLQRIRSVGKVAELQHLLDDVESPARYRPHSLGDPRHAGGAQCPPAHERRKGRGRPQRHHRESRRAACGTEARGFQFQSDTDTEVIAHLLADLLDQGNDIAAATRGAIARLVGAYALAVMDPADPDRLIVTRVGSPLVIGIGDGEHFIASDVFALLPVTQRFLFLEEGDLAEIRRDGVRRLRRVRPSGAARDPHQPAVGGECREGTLPALHAEGDLRAAGR
jgi:glucosamine--fructose-6-phosphate aminotransferase (isomerizing)